MLFVCVCVWKSIFFHTFSRVPVSNPNNSIDINSARHFMLECKAHTHTNNHIWKKSSLHLSNLKMLTVAENVWPFQFVMMADVYSSRRLAVHHRLHGMCCLARRILKPYSNQKSIAWPFRLNSKLISSNAINKTHQIAHSHIHITMWKLQL